MRDSKFCHILNNRKESVSQADVNFEADRDLHHILFQSRMPTHAPLPEKNCSQPNVKNIEMF